MKKYYKRKIDEELKCWTSSNDRKPLLLRGARQVGKTSAVKHTPPHQTEKPRTSKTMADTSREVSALVYYLILRRKLAAYKISALRCFPL